MFPESRKCRLRGMRSSCAGNYFGEASVVGGDGAGDGDKGEAHSPKRARGAWCKGKARLIEWRISLVEGRSNC